MKRRARRRSVPSRSSARRRRLCFGFSTDRRIAFFNSGCEKLTGWPADEVVGQLCEYVADPRSGSLEALAASLCPPAEAFAGQIVSVPTLIACKTGDPQPRSLSFIPLLEEEGSLAGVLGVAAVPGPGCEFPPRPLPRTSFTPSWRRSASRWPAVSEHSRSICRSEGMLRVAGQLAIARGTRAAVLIWGEKGVGKEHVARAIHYESDWRTRAFVPLDCQGLSSLELEQAMGRLFGPSRDEEFFDSTTALRPGTIFLTHADICRATCKRRSSRAFAQSAERAGLRLIASTTVEPSVLEADERLRPDFYHLITHLCIMPSRRCGAAWRTSGISPSTCSKS